MKHSLAVWLASGGEADVFGRLVVDVVLFQPRTSDGCGAGTGACSPPEAEASFFSFLFGSPL